MRKLLLVGALAALVASGCSSGTSSESEETTDDTVIIQAGDEPTTTTLTPASTTTTTEVPQPLPEPDGEGFDIDREFSPDSDAEALGPIGATETTIATAEGEVSIGGGDVPDTASEFPLPDDFEVQLASEVEGSLGFSGRTDVALADLIEFYTEALPAAGYEIVGTESVPDVFVIFTVEGDLSGDIVISQEPGGDGWTILVGLAEN